MNTRTLKLLPQSLPHPSAIALPRAPPRNRGAASVVLLPSLFPVLLHAPPSPPRAPTCSPLLSAPLSSPPLLLSSLAVAAPLSLSPLPLRQIRLLPVGHRPPSPLAPAMYGATISSSGRGSGGKIRRREVRIRMPGDTCEAGDGWPPHPQPHPQARLPLRWWICQRWGSPRWIWFCVCGGGRALAAARAAVDGLDSRP